MISKYEHLFCNITVLHVGILFYNSGNHKNSHSFVIHRSVLLIEIHELNCFTGITVGKYGNYA